ncbi:S-layer homology domain-containing protein [Paenibacillus lutrae]|nr:S-layer homology domain-containing protein [Paenibacillus lutrae]
MKKSLSVILSTAMALSVFSSVAFGAKADDFSDLKDLDAATKAKFDSMIQAGIFDGVEEGRFGLKDKMNRAQFAKVAALVFELKSNATTSSFTDVKPTSVDPANGYALPYIEALRVAGLTDGKEEGKYVPAGDVTKEELATFLVRGLGKESEALAKPGVSDQTVSGWAKGYVQMAQELKLFDTPAGQPFNGSTPATRDLLVTASYQAQQVVNASKKLSVTEAKATGIKKVSVKFNREVDTTKATLALKRGSAAVATDVVWAEDKKSAELTLKDVKIIDGTYSVTLSGVDSSTVDKSTAEFQATDEKVTSIDFLNTSDSIAYGKKVGIKIKASNQYGENASFSASNYTVFTSNVENSLKKNEDGTLVLTLKVDDRDSSGRSLNGLTQGMGVIPVNIFNNDSRVAKDKTFKVNVAPYATKLELSDVVYSNNSKTLANVGETATVNLYQYDQFGNIISDVDAGNISSTPNVIVTPYEKGLTVSEKTFEKVVFSLTEKASSSAEYTATIYAGASSATTKLSVKSNKFAKKVEFGDFSGSLSAGDGEKFLPINVFDESGNALTAQEIVDNADIIKVNSSVEGVSLQLTGENKGKIRIAGIPATLENGYMNISVSIIAPGVNSYVNKNFKIDKARIADSLSVATESKQKAIAGAETDLILKVKDQNGEVVNSVTNGDYSIQVTTEGTNSGIKLVNKDASALTPTYNNTKFEDFNKGFTIQTEPGATGTIKVVTKLLKNGAEIDSVTREVTIAKADEKLTYNVAAVSDLFAILDNASAPAADKANAYDSKMGRSVTIEAKDAAGKTVAVPSNFITGVSSSDNTVVKAVYADNAGKAKLVGNKAGTANVVVTFKTASGESSDQTLAVKVKNDAVAVASLTSKSAKKYVNDVYTTMELKAKDNYGIEYAYDANIAAIDTNVIEKYDAFLGIRFSISGIVTKANGTDNGVSLGSNGTLNIGNDVIEFTLKATAPNGTSTTTLVTK